MTDGMSEFKLTYDVVNMSVQGNVELVVADIKPVIYTGKEIKPELDVRLKIDTDNNKVFDTVIPRNIRSTRYKDKIPKGFLFYPKCPNKSAARFLLVNQYTFFGILLSFFRFLLFHYRKRLSKTKFRGENKGP